MNSPQNAQDVWKLFAEVSEQLKETDKRMKETDRQMKETDRQMKRNDKETNKKIRQLGAQIGGLARKFGSYTEHLAFPSIKKILREKFNVDVIYQNVEAKNGADQMEIDVIGYANKKINKVYVVEIKSKLNTSELKSTLKNLRRFTKFFPEHKNKAIYGIVSALDYTPQIRQKALDAGIYFSIIHDDLFQIDVPDSFVPKRFDNQ